MSSYGNSMSNLHSGGTPIGSQSFGLMGTSIKLASRSDLSLNGSGSASLSGSRNNLGGSNNDLSGGTRAGSTFKLSASSNPRRASANSARSAPGSRPKSPSSSSHRASQAPIGGSDAHAPSRSTLLIDGFDPHHVVSSTHTSAPAAAPIVLPPKQAWGDQTSRYHVVSAVLPGNQHHHPPNASGASTTTATSPDALGAHTRTHAHPQSAAEAAAAAATTIPTPPHSPMCPASPATDDAMSVTSSSSCEEYSPRKSGRASGSRNPLRRGANAGGAGVNSQERFYDWKKLKQQTHRRNTENWAMESIVVRRLRYLVDHIDELDGKHLSLLAALEESGVTNAQLQQYFPYVTSIHDLKLHLTTLLMDRQHRQHHPHSHPNSSTSTSESMLALSASELAPAVPGAPKPRTLNRASPAAPPPNYPRGAPTVARRAYGHKQPLVTPVEVLKIVEQFNPVSLAVQDAVNGAPVSRVGGTVKYHSTRAGTSTTSSTTGGAAAVRSSIKTLERTQQQAQASGRVSMLSQTRSRNEVGMVVGGGMGGAGYVK